MRCVLTNKKDSCSFYFLSEKPLFVLQAYACYGGLRQKRAMFIKEEIAAEASTWEKVEGPVPLLYFFKEVFEKKFIRKESKKGLPAICLCASKNKGQRRAEYFAVAFLF